ncbi:MAG: sugar transferase [Clostridia bacterium]|nr:sugar transferase [Clostridia bacterium]
MKTTKRGGTFYEIVKRLFDFAASTVALIALALPMLVVAIVIVCDSRGPVFYRSQRIGKGGKKFTFLKFRTMCVDADERKEELLEKNEIEGGVIFKITDDPRITRVGKTLRKFSIDELPQLICVLRGDMSLIGPRPGTPQEVALYDERAMRRLEVKQGLSGEWQVRGRNDVSFAEMIDMDLDYIDNKRSMLYDLKLIFLSVAEIFKGTGK